MSLVKIIIFLFVIVLSIFLVLINRKGKNNINIIPLNDSSPIKVSSEITQAFASKSLSVLNFFVSVIMPNIDPVQLGINISSFDNIILNYKGEGYELVYINNFITSYLDNKTQKDSQVITSFYNNNTLVVQNLITISLGQALQLGLNAANKRGEVKITSPKVTIDITCVFPLNTYVPQNYTVNNVWIDGQLTYSNFSYLTPLVNYFLSDVIDENILGNRLKIILNKGQTYIEKISSLLDALSPLPLIQLLTLLAQSFPFLSSYINSIIDDIEKEESIFYNFKPLFLQPNTTTYKGYTYPVAGPSLLTYSPTSYIYSPDNIDKVNSLYKRIEAITCSPFTITYSDSDTNKDIKELIDLC